MSKRIVTLSVLSVFSVIVLLWLFYPPTINVSDEVSSSDEEIEKGKYLVTAGGCISCHRGQTDQTSESLAGGLAIETEFGTFYAPNITPDTSTGIGTWKAEDFIRALKHGRRPSGGFYYPSFPYRDYSKLSDEDILSMASYLMSQEPVFMQAPEPETPIWLARWMVAGWNKLADLSGTPDEIYSRPATKFVGSFIGSPAMNFIPIESMIQAGDTEVQVGDQKLAIPRQKTNSLSNHNYIGVRPEKLEFDDNQGIPGKVYGNEYLGNRKICTVETGFGQLKVRVAKDTSININDSVRVKFSPESAILFDGQTELALLSENQ